MAGTRQQSARSRVAHDLHSLQDEFFNDWMAQSLPDGWHGIGSDIDPPKREITVELDEDMLRWFKRHARSVDTLINRILRVYWQSVLSGDTRFHWDPAVYGPSQARFLESLVHNTIDRLDQEGTPQAAVNQLRAALDDMKYAHRKVDPLLEALERSAEFANEQAKAVAGQAEVDEPDGNTNESAE